jgi:hypothetical protein
MRNLAHTLIKELTTNPTSFDIPSRELNSLGLFYDECKRLTS